jgi:hypothetical protein
MSEEYKERLRELLRTKGHAVVFSERDFEEVSPYGWTYFRADHHCTPKISSLGLNRNAGDCQWVIPEGAKVVERTYSMFAGTFTDNDSEVGINVSPVHCQCGKYKDMTLRYTASLGETIRALTMDDNDEGLVL